MWCCVRLIHTACLMTSQFFSGLNVFKWKWLNNSLICRFFQNKSWIQSFSLQLHIFKLTLDEWMNVDAVDTLIWTFGIFRALPQTQIELLALLPQSLLPPRSLCRFVFILTPAEIEVKQPWALSGQEENRLVILSRKVSRSLRVNQPSLAELKKKKKVRPLSHLQEVRNGEQIKEGEEGERCSEPPSAF